MPIEIDITENALYKWANERGISQGMSLGEAKILTKFLERRFGPLPDSVRTRITSADVETLDRWTDRMDTATTLDAVFAD